MVFNQNDRVQVNREPPAGGKGKFIFQATSIPRSGELAFAAI
jgi:hypothetical protein